MEAAIAVAASLLIVALFFSYYFRNFVFKRSRFLQLRAFFLGVLSSGLTLVVQSALPETDSPLLRALFHAAFIEEGIRLLFLYILFRFSSRDFTVTEGIFEGVMLGLGFAITENVQYGLAYSGYVILLRAVSSVPLHVFASAIMGYYLAHADLCRIADTERGLVAGGQSNRARRFRLRGLGIFLPWGLHGVYDFCLLSGGRLVYLVPLLLIGAYLLVEYLIERGRLIFGRNVLTMLGINADDVDTLLRQKEYEKWLLDTQTVDEPEPRLLHLRVWPLHRTIAGLALCVLALALFLLYETKGAEAFAVLRIHHQASLISLLVLYPASVGLMLLLSGKINYLYVRNKMLRVPVPIRVRIFSDRGGGAEEAIALDLRPSGVFLNVMEDYERSDLLVLEFEPDKQLPVRILAQVHWSNLHNDMLPIGHILHFQRQTLRFVILRWKHLLRRLYRRLRPLAG
ncbi:MAG: PrsW family intramembrane metalloprotease [Spirochaetales bacterium]|nr:PrsW family intramembrane metalloprotease [Leptospiraceae bacterium]MCP5481234.1 PrsW family intramembrane metalloprotease [Spirochaetales bacterium]MCP5485670.1 PrsW family intramembrane metalloprotease [Spirochaetales bacterium]